MPRERELSSYGNRRIKSIYARELKLGIERGRVGIGGVIASDIKAKCFQGSESLGSISYKS